MSRSKKRTPISDRDPMVGTLINAMRVGVWTHSDFDKFLEPYGITLMQFNTMRILYRDPDNAGLPSGQLTQFMLTRVPDVPRLLDRIVKLDLIERSPSPDDRRVVLIKLTKKGTDLIEGMMDAVYEHCRQRTAHMTAAELAQLHALLVKLYAGLPRDQA